MSVWLLIGKVLVAWVVVSIGGGVAVLLIAEGNYRRKMRRQSASVAERSVRREPCNVRVLPRDAG